MVKVSFLSTVQGNLMYMPSRSLLMSTPSNTVNATANLPKHAKVSVYPSIPHMAFTGRFSIYEQETSNICANATEFTPPAGDDAGYHCPKAGLYNVRTLFTMFGSVDTWWSNLYGFNIVFILKIEDLDENKEYASCYLQAMVLDGDDGSITTNAGFLGILGLSGLAAGLMLRKRKNERSEIESKDHNHFELITEPAARV
jgi:hypothetical protein